MKRAVILDFDGTIADTVVAFARVFEEVTKQPEPLTAERMKQLKGMSGTEFMRTFNLPKWKVPYLIFRGKKLLRQHMGDVELYAGMRDIIKHLHSMGVPLYIVSSNNTDTIQTYLKQQGIATYFIAVSGGASPFAKARKLLRLIDANNVDLSASWYVGDETRDIIAAHAVGIPVLSVTWGFNTREALQAKEPDEVVDTPAELQQFLQAWWNKK